MSEIVRTRFAPSPTGYLHIGGARTALFNYLLAKRLGGKFILRIEDTDQTRNIERADEKLVDDLRWLGLHWDEGPGFGGPAGTYYQSQRLELYTERVRHLLDSGRAYYAMETREELEAMRRAAQRQGLERGFRYRRPTRFPSEGDAQKSRQEGRPVVIRFKMPERDFIVNDRILGDVQIGAAELADFVIIKADGWPTYHFAVVVDDFAMLITHVLRGQEHLMNTPNHMALQEAFGYPTPAYAHLPIIFNMNGTKMSKREKDKVVREAVKAGGLDDTKVMQLAGLSDAKLIAAWREGDTQLEGDALQRLAHGLAVRVPEINIHDFRVSGYLPEVLLNFIALLGWSPGDSREKFSLEELCAAFSLERVGKTNARFDRAKLLSFNTMAAAAAEPARLLAAFKDYLSVNADSPLRGRDDTLLARLLKMNAGFRVFGDVDRKCAAIFVDDSAVQYDEAAVEKVLRKGHGAGLETLRKMKALLESAPAWTAAELERVIKGYAEENDLSLGKVAQPIRVAVTGTTISPPIFDTLELLGREKALSRIARTLERFAL